MQPTSDERREVAERLRNLAGHIAADEEMTLDALGLYRGENIEGYDTYGVMHLADLIDPTCHIVLRQSDSDFTDEPHTSAQGAARRPSTCTSGAITRSLES